MAATNNYGTRLAKTLTVLCFLAGFTEEVDQPTNNVMYPAFLERHMRGLTEQQPFSPQARIRKTPSISLRLTFIIMGLLLSVMPLLTGCGGDEGSPSAPGVTASLAWSPVPDPSVHSYFVYYGRQSPGQPGSCAYESSVQVDSPSVTLTNLDPNTAYYFAVSAYNGTESACSSEVSTVTPPAYL